VNVDAKLVVDPYKYMPIADFAGQYDKDQISSSQAEYTEKVEVISITSTISVCVWGGGGGNALSKM
jgi:hypothetical protein